MRTSSKPSAANPQNQPGTVARRRSVFHATIRKTLELAAEWLAQLFATKSEVAGLRVLLFDVRKEQDDFTEQLAQTIQLIGDVDPRRYRRMLTDVRQVLITDSASSAYLRRSRTVLLSAELVRKRDPVRTALTLVHESTHARLARCEEPAIKRIAARVESRCVREQQSFLERLRCAGYSGTEAWVAHLEVKLATVWWEDSTMVAHKAQWARAGGLPPWLVRLFETVFRGGKGPS